MAKVWFLALRNPPQRSAADPEDLADLLFAKGVSHRQVALRVNHDRVERGEPAGMGELGSRGSKPMFLARDDPEHQICVPIVRITPQRGAQGGRLAAPVERVRGDRGLGERRLLAERVPAGGLIEEGIGTTW